MTRRNRSRSALSAALLAALSFSSLGAQEPRDGEEPAAQQAEDRFFDVIDVNVVNVDVYVTDKKGNPISGLSKSDFELFEDDKPMAITNFYAVEEFRAAGAEAGTAESEPETPPRLEARIPAELAIPEDQRLHLVVYIDNWNIAPHNRNRVFSGIREFLRSSLGPDDRVMLMTFDREPHLRRPFTSDEASIASALFEIEKISANGSRQASERREVLREIQDSDDPNRAIGRARMYAESAKSDLEFTIDAIKNTVSSLGGLPGRKAILYVSDGLPMSPGEDVFYAIQEKFPSETGAVLEARQYDVTRRINELIATANANRVTFYTIDAGGLRISTSVSAENRTAIASGAVDSVHWSNTQSTIRLMADETGGIAIVNTNDPRTGLKKVADDFGNYYSLGYSPAHSGDGRYHDIEVKVRNRDWLVRHRDGYRDKTADARMSDGLISSLFYNAESNALGVFLDHGSEMRRDDGYYIVPVEVKIPIGNLVLVPQGDVHVARVRVYLAAMDDASRLSEIQQLPVPIEIPSAEVESAREKTWVVTAQVVMRRGSQRLAVGVRDDVGQTSSFTMRSMVIGGG